MTTLNHDIPHLRVWVRDAFLHDLDTTQRGRTPGTAHAVCTIKGRALGFHVLLDNGAHISRLPIHALVTREDAPEVPLDEPWRLQLWNCFSYDAVVTEYEWLQGCRVRVALPDGKHYGGTYLFTVDYYGCQDAEAAGDAGWKCHHLIELDNGLLAAQPNNRVCWYEPSCTEPFPADQPPAYRTMSRTWSVEDGAKWRPEGEKMFYDVEVVG